MGEKLPRILPKVATSTSLLVSFTCRKFTTWDRRLYFPSEGWRAEDFFALKIRRLPLGLNPRTRGTKGQHAHLYRPPKPLRGTALLILKAALDGGEWLISYTVAFRRYPLNRRLCWPLNRSESSGGWGWGESIAPYGNRITGPSGIQRNNVPLL